MDSAATDKPDITQIKNSIRVSRLVVIDSDVVGDFLFLSGSLWWTFPKRSYVIDSRFTAELVIFYYIRMSPT